MKHVLVFEDVVSDQFSAECRWQKKEEGRCRRLHFFDGDPCAGEPEYGGYCDLRPDGSVAEAFITIKTVKNAQSESYAFFPCVIETSFDVSINNDGTKRTYDISGFYYIEKNNRETMCAQALLYGVAKYWRHQAKRFEKVKTTIDINIQAGLVNPSDCMDGRGLNIEEMQRFFASNNVPFWMRNYAYMSANAVSAEHVLQDVYGFIESGLPVVAAIKTDRGLHAITIIGHTFDKNSWRAMADVGYFTMTDSAKPVFLPNVTWVENLVVVDDNFGPYHFFPSCDLESMIVAMFVPLPVAKMLRPHEAVQLFAEQTLVSESFTDLIQYFLDSDELLPQNRSWLEVFARQLEVRCGSGLVLRPFLRDSSQVPSVYGGHEFADPLRKEFAKQNRCGYYWIVEFSWPDVYCFQQSRCGSVIFRADDSDMSFVVMHIPGVLIAFERGKRKLEIVYAKAEDAPHPHEKPG
ncbi:MAG: hypothetical protein ACOX9C_09350 [Kiritimatiellia bacterium]